MSKWWKRKASNQRFSVAVSSAQLEQALAGHDSSGGPVSPAWLPPRSGGHAGGGHGRLSPSAGAVLANESDPLNPDPSPGWAARHRALRRCLLRTCSVKPPLEQPALLAAVLSYLPVVEALSLQRVCVAWRRLLLRADLVYWKAVCRAGAVPPALRGALWVALGYHPTSPPSPPYHRVGYGKAADVCRWSGLLQPFPPRDGPLRDTHATGASGDSAGAGAGAGAGAAAAGAAPRRPVKVGRSGIPAAASRSGVAGRGPRSGRGGKGGAAAAGDRPPPPAEDMLTLFERYHKCGLICEEASDGVGKWRTVLKELSAIRSKQVQLLEKAVGSGSGALSPQDTAEWTALRDKEKTKEALVASIKQSSRPAVDVALSSRADADAHLAQTAHQADASCARCPPAATTAAPGRTTDRHRPRRRSGTAARGHARGGAKDSDRRRRSRAAGGEPTPGSLEALTLPKSGGNLWCSGRVPVPTRVLEAVAPAPLPAIGAGAPSPSPSPGGDAGAPAAGADLWTSPHLIIEADVIRTFGLMSPRGSAPSSVSSGFASAASWPVPTPVAAPDSAASGSSDATPPASRGGDAAAAGGAAPAGTTAATPPERQPKANGKRRTLTARERALARLRGKLAASRESLPGGAAKHRRRSSVHVAASSAASASSLAAALARDSSKSGAAVAAAAAAKVSAAPTPLTVDQERAQLRQLLIAYSALDDAVGYCQGMNFVAALVLRHMPKEIAFWFLAVLLRHYQFDTIYSPGLKRVGLCFYQLDRLLEFHLPELHAHLAAENVSPDMYSSGWFMTMFSSMDVLPYDTTCAVWDAFLVDGWKALFRVILALLDHVTDDVLAGDFPVIVQFLNTLPPDRVPPKRALFAAATRFKVTNRTLAAMETQYFKAMAPPPSSPITAVAPASSAAPVTNAASRTPPLSVSAATTSASPTSGTRPRASSLESPVAKPRTPSNAGDTDAGYASDSAASPAARHFSLAEWTANSEPPSSAGVARRGQPVSPAVEEPPSRDGGAAPPAAAATVARASMPSPFSSQSSLGDGSSEEEWSLVSATGTAADHGPAAAPPAQHLRPAPAAAAPDCPVRNMTPSVPAPPPGAVDVAPPATGGCVDATTPAGASDGELLRSFSSSRSAQPPPPPSARPSFDAGKRPTARSIGGKLLNRLRRK